MNRKNPTNCLTSWSFGPKTLLRIAVLVGLMGISRAVYLHAEQTVDPFAISLDQLAEIKIDSVVGASKFLQKTTEAPSSITVITAEEIQKYGYRSFADIMRHVRGFYVTNDRNYNYLGVRGFARPGDYSTRILQLIDGHRVNDNVIDSAFIGLDLPLDVDLIDRVEVIRGPSSSLYGASAFLAVINIITKSGQSMEGVNLSADLASFGTRKGQASYGSRLKNGLEMLFSGSYYDSRGQSNLYYPEFDTPETNYGIARRADNEQFDNLFTKVSFNGLTFQAAYGSRGKQFPTGAFETVFNDPRNQTTDRRGYMDLQYERNLGHDWSLSSRLYYDRYSYNGDYVYDYSATGPADLVVNKDYTKGNWWGTEVKVDKKLASKHTLTFGSEYRGFLAQNQWNFDEDPFALYLDDKRRSNTLGVYVQGDFVLHPKWTLNVGGRCDRYPTFGSTFNPRLALIFKPYPKTDVKLLYGHAFRAPSAYELYYWQNGVAKQNPFLDPETIKTAEVVFERQFGKNFRLSAGGFYYRIRDLINQVTDASDELLVYRNLDRVVAKGLELELERYWAGGLRSRASYAFQNSKNVLTGSSLTNSPRHLAQANIEYPFWNKAFYGGLDFLLMSKRRTLAGDQVNGYVIPNLTLFSNRLPKGLELSATLYNVLNRRYSDPGSEEHVQDAIQQDGRAFRLKLTYRLRPSR